MPAFESKEDYYYDALQRIEVLCQEDELGAPSEKRFAIINLIHDIATATLHDEPEIYDSQEQRKLKALEAFVRGVASDITTYGSVDVVANYNSISTDAFRLIEQYNITADDSEGE